MKRKVFEIAHYEMIFNYHQEESSAVKLGIVSLAFNDTLTVISILAVTDALDLIPVDVIKPAQRDLLLDPFSYLKKELLGESINSSLVIENQVPLLNSKQVILDSNYVTFEIEESTSNVDVIGYLRKLLLDTSYILAGRSSISSRMESISAYELKEDYELIVGVAIMHKNYMVSLPRPNRHHNVLESVAITVPETEWPVGLHQGFITSKGRYVNREEARKIAINSGQFVPAKGDTFKNLYSEDLW